MCFCVLHRHSRNVSQSGNAFISLQLLSIETNSVESQSSYGFMLICPDILHKNQRMIFKYSINNQLMRSIQTLNLVHLSTIGYWAVAVQNIPSNSLNSWITLSTQTHMRTSHTDDIIDTHTHIAHRITIGKEKKTKSNCPMPVHISVCACMRVYVWSHSHWTDTDYMNVKSDKRARDFYLSKTHKDTHTVGGSGINTLSAEEAMGFRSNFD